MEASLTRRGVGLVAAAVGGAALALGGAALLGGFDGGSTTVRELVAQPSASPAVFKSGKQLSIREIYERRAPGVVQVTSTGSSSSGEGSFPSNPFPLPGSTALGSGFVIDKGGHVVTNYHVVQGARTVQVSFSSNESVQARIVGSDPSTDLAVLQVSVPSRALTALPLGNSDRVQVGDSVVAIGNPFGLNRSASAGIVSALQRQIAAPNRYAIDHVIQTDAAINHGNSGGPLLDAQGEVIGVNAQIETGSSGDGNVGIGFAIPVNTVRDVVAQLIRTGKVEHPALGIRGQAISGQLARVFRLPVAHGVLVEAVLDGSGADEAGLRAGSTRVMVAGDSYLLGGDIIVAAGGVEIRSLDRLRDLIAAKEPGDRIELRIYRGEEAKTLTVELGRQPATSE